MGSVGSHKGTVKIWPPTLLGRGKTINSMAIFYREVRGLSSSINKHSPRPLGSSPPNTKSSMDEGVYLSWLVPSCRLT